MKRYLIKTLLVISFLNLSCEESLDITQPGILTDQITISNEVDMQSYLNGIYAQLNNDNQVVFTSIFTDETGIGVGTGGQNFDTHRFQINSANTFASGIWYNNHNVIARINRFLKNSGNITPTNQTNYNNMIAQAKAMRAYSYMELLYYFSTDMKNDNSLACMLIEGIEEYTSELPRSTTKVISDAIEKDLIEAYPNLLASNSYLTFRRNTVDAMRARFYLFRGNYILAEQYAIAASTGFTLSNSTTIPAGLVDSDLGILQTNPASIITTTNTKHVAFSAVGSTNNYRRMFVDATQGEIIFAFNRPSAGTWSNIYSNFAFNTSTATGGLMFEVGRTLFNKLNALPNDIRKFNVLDPTSQIDPNYSTLDANSVRERDVLVIDKLPGKSGQNLRNNSKIFRLSEMQLIIAECRARANDLAAATNIIEQIRTARKYTSGSVIIPDYSTISQALIQILLERELELCFEGHRYLDLKRLGSDPLVNKSIERDNVDDVLTGLELTIPVGDYRYTLPVPRTEINANPTIVQNPGY
jgi:starch-binding outer membrane protein, SusD/RagB family